MPDPAIKRRRTTFDPRSVREIPPEYRPRRPIKRIVPMRVPINMDLFDPAVAAFDPMRASGWDWRNVPGGHSSLLRGTGLGALPLGVTLFAVGLAIAVGLAVTFHVKEAE